MQYIHTQTSLLHRSKFKIVFQDGEHNMDPCQCVFIHFYLLNALLQPEDCHVVLLNQKLSQRETY